MNNQEKAAILAELDAAAAQLRYIRKRIESFQPEQLANKIDSGSVMLEITNAVNDLKVLMDRISSQLEEDKHK